jgi:hypothetical protein
MFVHVMLEVDSIAPGSTARSVEGAFGFECAKLRRLAQDDGNILITIESEIPGRGVLTVGLSIEQARELAAALQRAKSLPMSEVVP